MAYGSVSELRDRMNKTSTDDDTILAALIAAAQRNIDQTCNRPDGFEADVITSARLYSGSGRPYQLIDECISITLVEVKGSATDDTYDSWETTDWIAFSGDHRWPDFNTLPYTGLMVDPTGDEAVFTTGWYTTRGGFRPLTDQHRGVPTVRITARWGYSQVVPVDIKEACLMQAARWYKRFQSSMSDVLASGELGVLLYRQSLDPDIARILVDGRYVKPAIGVW